MAIFSGAMIAAFVAYFVLGMWKADKYLALPQWKQLAIALPLVAAFFVWIGFLNCGAQRAEPVWAEGVYPIHWQEVPVPVYADHEVAGESLTEAVKLWNRAVSCTLLRLVPDEADAKILVGQGSYDGVFVGRTDIDLATDRVIVQLLQPGNPTHDYLVFAHELGRALGLATDPSKWSIMASGVQTLDIGSLPRVSQKDAEALEERYCRPTGDRRPDG